MKIPSAINIATFIEFASQFKLFRQSYTAQQILSGKSPLNKIIIKIFVSYISSKANPRLARMHPK
jgi:hypothetical protein